MHLDVTRGAALAVVACNMTCCRRACLCAQQVLLMRQALCNAAHASLPTPSGAAAMPTLLPPPPLRKRAITATRAAVAAAHQMRGAGL